MRHFEFYKEGLCDEFAGRHEITEEEIIEFGTRWDPQPFHTNLEAAKTSPFGGLVSPAVHLFSIAIGLVTKVPEEDKAAIVSGLGFDSIQLKAPARPGDTLRAKGTVVESRPSKSKPNIGIVKFYNELINQNEEVVFTYESTILVAKQI
ncbi:MAG: MaoC family dehydratase N-terminal domain-containing protein [Flavobacteriales bacterium]|nr:MaoC family dehydratase N-terminal domain-containing protein [Flavobacteriales bacterium]